MSTTLIGSFDMDNFATWNHSSIIYQIKRQRRNKKIINLRKKKILTCRGTKSIKGGFEE